MARRGCHNSEVGTVPKKVQCPINENREQKVSNRRRSVDVASLKKHDLLQLI